MLFFFFNDTATTEIYTLSLHDALPILFGHWITVNYRESYNMFTCAGIFFNHESPLRGLEFVTRKITYGVARIKHGLQDRIVLGNLDSKRDWGYAPEYVKAMWMMLQQPEPDDYVVATGETHSVREFVEYAFRFIGMEIEWQVEETDERGIDSKTGKLVVEVSPEFFRPSEVNTLKGDYSKASEKLGWKPSIRFEDLVGIMVEADLKRMKG